MKDSGEFVVDLDEGRVASDTVSDCVDVTDLHGESECAKGFRPDRLEETISNGEKEFGERNLSDFGDDIEGLLRDFSYRGDLTAGFEEEETAKVVERGSGTFELLAKFCLVTDPNDVVESVDDHLGVRRSFSRHVFDGEDETSNDFDAMFRNRPRRKVDFRSEEVDSHCRSSLALPRRVVTDASESSHEFADEC